MTLAKAYENIKSTSNGVDISGAGGLTLTEGNLKVQDGITFKNDSATTTIQTASRLEIDVDQDKDNGRAGFLISESGQGLISGAQNENVISHRTLEVQGAILPTSSIFFQNTNRILAFAGVYGGGTPDDGVTWPDQGGGSQPVLSCNSAGEIIGIDDSGNQTTLT